MILFKDITVDKNESNTTYCQPSWYFIEQLISRLGGKPGSYNDDIRYLYECEIYVVHVNDDGTTNRLVQEPWPALRYVLSHADLALEFDTPEYEMLFRLRHL